MVSRLKGLRHAVAAFLALSIVSPSALAQEPAFTPAQRQAIEDIVREYLLRKPEILQEVITELEKRQAEAQQKAQATALTEAREALFNSVHGNVVGNPQGDVTLVEFFDYNCGYCKRALADIRELMRSDNRLKVVLKDLPVLGPDSVEASRVALAVKQQISGDRLFEYHARLMETRGRIGAEQALKVARDMKLDMARLQKDMSGPAVAAALSENQMLGQKLALSGTPAFVVGDQVISGAVGVEPLRHAVAMTRQCGRASC